jgi:putative ubiquitin-RnfH superfamily antitoxin RatB of RatAB toxin-antitoxin module
MPRVVVVSTLTPVPVVRELEVPEGASVGDAVLASGIVSLLDYGSLQNISLGVFSKVISYDMPVRDGDRIEVYRPLAKSASDARRARVRRKPGRTR